MAHKKKSKSKQLHINVVPNIAYIFNIQGESMLIDDQNNFWVFDDKAEEFRKMPFKFNHDWVPEDDEDNGIKEYDS